MTGWQFSRAQTEAPFGGGPGDDNYSPTEQGLSETGSSDPNDYDFNDYDQGGGLTEGNQQGELEKARKEAEKKCEEEAGLGSMIDRAGSLANTLSQGWRQQLPQTLNDFVRNELSGLVQERFKAVLPDLIQTSLKNHLPSYVNNAIGDLVRTGVSPNSTQVTNIINQGVNSIVSNTIKNETPRIINDTISRGLPSFLSRRFGSQAAEIINGNSDLVNRVKDAVNQAVTASQQAQQQANKDAQWSLDTMAQSNPLLGAPDINGMVDNTNLTDAQKQELTQNVLNGIASSTAKGVANGSGVVDLGKTLAPIISGKIIPSILSQITSSFSGAASSGSFSGAVDTTVGGLFGSGYDASQGLTGSFFKPITDSLVMPMGTWSYSFADTFAQTGNLAGSFDVATNGGFDAADLQGPVDAEGDYAPDNTGAPELGSNEVDAELGSSGLDAQGQVEANAGDIGNNAVSGGALTGLGNSLKGSLAGALGGMVGDLVGNIPVVGGLLGPIAQQMVTQAMLALMGLPADFLGFPVADVGLGFNVSQGFKGQGKITNEIVKNSAKSNENEKHLNDTQDKAKTLTAQICVYNKMQTTEAKSVTDELYTHGPNARNAAYNAALEARNAANEYLASSHAVSSGATGVPDNANGNNGQPAVANPKTNINNAIKEAENKVQTLAASNNSGNFQGDAVVKAHQQITKPSFQQQFKSNTTKEQFDSLGDPQKLDNMKSEELWKLREAAIFDDFDSAWLAYDEESAIQASNAGTLALAQYNANQGWNDTRQCTLWNDAPMAGDLSAGEPNGLGGLKWCWDWAVLTPGSTNKAMAEKLNNLPYDFAANTQNVRGDSINPTLGDPLKRLTDMSAEPAQYETQTGSDPCPGTDPCPNTGWRPNQVSSLSNGLATGANNLMNSAANYASSVFNLGKYGGSNGDGNGGGTFINPSNFSLPNLTISPPNITKFTYNQTTRKVEWSAGNSFVCRANNEWPGTNPTISEGDILNTTGSTDVAPGTVESSYSLSCFNLMFQQDTNEVSIPTP
jgi:hypothetical protein